MAINSPLQNLQFMMSHRNSIEEPAPHVAADDADYSEDRGDLQVLAEAGVDVPPLDDDELPYQAAEHEAATDVEHLLKQAMSFGLHD